jgi:hypothetical protein
MFDDGTVQRSLFDIITDLNALTNTQKTNIAADLFAGTPPKCLQYIAGSNLSALLVLYFTVQTATLSTADKNLAKLYAAGLYVQDNPNYLKQPSFDATINVAGAV